MRRPGAVPVGPGGAGWSAGMHRNPQPPGCRSTDSRFGSRLPIPPGFPLPFPTSPANSSMSQPLPRVLGLALASLFLIACGGKRELPSDPLAYVPADTP
jgi:hypothetical protein